MKFQLARIAKVFLSSTLVAGLGFAISACAKQEDQKLQVIHFSTDGILGSNKTSSDKAEELARAAELLMEAQGFEKALAYANLALAQDPKNVRAGLIKSFTAILVVQKGILVRLHSIAEKNPEILRELKNLTAAAKAQISSKFFDFLLDGKPDIETESQVQAHVDLMIQLIENFRVFVKANKNIELTVNAKAFWLSKGAEKNAESCKIQNSIGLEHELVCSGSSGQYEVTLNRADFENMGYMAAYYEMYLAGINAYNLSGSVQVLSKHPGKGTVFSQQISEELFQSSDFGRLRASSQLKKMKHLGMDMVGGMNWALKNSKSFCPKSYFRPTQRVGALFDSRVCNQPATKAYLDLIETIFQNNLVDSKYEKSEGVVYRTKMNAMAIFEQPPVDLRDLGTIRVDRCGQVQSLGDSTLGGIFPNGDGNTVLPMLSKECVK